MENNYRKKIDDTETRFQETISDIRVSDDTFLRRSLLNVAIKQNDLIFTLKQKQKNGDQ